MAEELIERFRALGVEAVENGTYALHESTQAFRWSSRFPGQVLCLEVRRDLLVERYTPFEEMRVRPDAADRIAAPIASAIDRQMRR